jgi:hypothetical protein
VGPRSNSRRRIAASRILSPSILMLALLFRGRKNITACSTSSVTRGRIGVRFAIAGVDEKPPAVPGLTSGVGLITLILGLITT